ncbi:MAG: Holliday junction branch migration protein RuvA [Candidatus Saccharibacteria bacterium]
MIGSLKGAVQYKSASFIILETNGVGYKVFLPPTLLFTLKIGQPLSLVIYTHVREDQFTLFGFSTLPELEFFELLLTVSGVGPKSALGIMSLESLDMIKSAIVSEDPSVFTKVSGIGRKTAERVIVELKEKLKTEISAAPIAREHSEALDALVSLGYSQQEARDALKDMPADADLQSKVKAALKKLNR